MSAMPDEVARHQQTLLSLWDAMTRPLTAPGSEALAQRAIAQFSDTDLTAALDRCATKLLATLDDDKRHDTMAVPAGGGVAVWCVTWPGPHDEVLPQRYGTYLGMLFNTAQWLVRSGVPVTGFLEMDCYVWADGLEIEYSFLPGNLIGGRASDDPLFRSVLLNSALCSDEERQALEKFTA
jgi:hypothetical protein